MHRVHTLIIGAGPAGLTAAVELARAGVREIVVLEASDQVGGLSRTVRYQGNRIDIGGHRFFSKSDWVMDWWRQMLPVGDDGAHPTHEAGPTTIAYHGKQRQIELKAMADAHQADDVMLLRNRLSRIYFGGRFFDYPLKPSLATALKLGPWRCVSFLGSYLKAQWGPKRAEVTLEDFFINRFGRGLYQQFFKEYTEKVWGRRCDQISAEWGAQRVKSLSIGKALGHAVLGAARSVLRPLTRALGMRTDTLVGQTPTSLIERFLYPKHGPGQMWEKAARVAQQLGVRVMMGQKVLRLKLEGPPGQQRVAAVCVRDLASGADRWIAADHVISTMPIKDLVHGMGDAVPEPVRKVAEALEYRDFMTVGLLYKSLTRGATPKGGKLRIIPDNWVYIQEPGVQVGRLQVFNNWSPWLVKQADTVWVGLEYFCQQDDALWSKPDDAMKQQAIAEMQAIGLARAEDCVDGVVIRMEKAYPGYYGAYAQFDQVRNWLDPIYNLFLVGRNGMHRYNNQDHSMLSAKAAVDAILCGSTDKAPIWAINIDDDYHESVQAQPDGRAAGAAAGVTPQAA